MPDQPPPFGQKGILEKLGEGGMARVWLAEEITFGNRQVTIKEPHGSLVSTDGSLYRCR